VVNKRKLMCVPLIFETQHDREVELELVVRALIEGLRARLSRT